MTTMPEPLAVSPAQRAEARGSTLGRILRMREFGLVLIILAIGVAMSFASPYFLTWANARAVMLSFSVEGIVVIGMTILLIAGGIDLSVGSVVCLAMTIAAWLFLAGLDPWTSSLVAIVACGGVGWLMGQAVTRIGLHFFIVSLAVMVIARGLCLLITRGTPLSLLQMPASFKFVGQGSWGPIPFVIVIFLALIAVFDLALRHSTFFRKVYYTGSNEKAARFAGIDTRRVKVVSATLCSALAGVAGVVFMARFGSATPNFGLGMELSVIAAAVIGGASLNGGSGTIAGAVLGAALLSLVTSCLILLNVPVYWQDIIKGAILLGAVTIDHLLNTRKGRAR